MNILTGQSILGFQRGGRGASAFTAFNPATGHALNPQYFSSSPEEIERAACLADEAFAIYGRLGSREKAIFLRRIADGLQAIAGQLVERAHFETALPKPRLEGEVVRTANQLRLFADVIEEGSWVLARIDSANPRRTPTPKPDIRSMLHPLGPVVVFGASNFPLAFSVAGGDTASALAAGNPVIVKAHPAHPGTSELAGQIIAESVRDCALPEGVFSLLFDAGTQVGTALVQHPLVKAVGFTGSLSAGRALMDLAASRPDPIPCFAEMSSTNPVFVLPGALEERSKQIAAGLFASFTLGGGQLCTKPGLVFLPAHERAGDSLVAELQSLVAEAPPFTMLTAGIAGHYKKTLDQRRTEGHATITAESAVASPSESNATHAVLFETDVKSLLANERLAEEVFGPGTLLVRYTQREQMLEAARSLHGHLTATLLGTEKDLRHHQDLIAILERKVGRLLFNGYPTGVEVCHAMVHGGPYPATSDGRSTSVGTQAIFRFARPVCYQQFPDPSLPQELQNENPRNILRMLDGVYTKSRATSGQP